MLIEGGYVVTNAHVVWPFEEVRVTFPDGSQFLDAPVINTDLMGDLAVIGPLDTVIDALDLTDGEDLAVGSDLFLIGYPAEGEEFPQPTITRGILSRFRQWEALEMTYFQTDALSIGGQSGGVLASDAGQVIGISGFFLSEARFGLVASATDILPRVRGLIAGEDVSGLGNRQVPLGGGRSEYSIRLRNIWDSRAYVVNVPVGTKIDFEVSSANDARIFLLDANGIMLTQIDERPTGSESGSAQTVLLAPYFLIVSQGSDDNGDFVITSNVSLIQYPDADDGKNIAAGETVLANVDYPADNDYFSIDLNAGETIVINVDSPNIDPIVKVHFQGASELVVDDDSGGGLFGTNAEVIYRAPHNGSYFIAVTSANPQVGGYLLTVKKAPPGAVLTPTIPIVPSTTVDYNLSSMLPTLNDLPAGLSIDSERFVDDTDALAEYERHFNAEDPGAQLGMSLVTNLGTSVELRENEADARFFVGVFKAFDPQAFGELIAQGMAEDEPGLVVKIVLAQSIEVPDLGDEAGAIVVRIDSSEGEFDFFFLLFSRGPLSGTVGVLGSQVLLEDVIPIAQLIIERIDNNPPRTPLATPVPTPAPARTVPAADTLTVAMRNLRSGAGTPRFCTAGCAETVYLAGIMETLTGVEAGPGGPLDPLNTPMLAESWELSPDQRYMDFKLRKGIPFHKGWGEMTAEDVAFSFNDANAYTTPESIHGQAGDFAPLIRSVEALDTYTARFNFSLFHRAMPMRYMGPFYQSAGIVPKAVFDRYGPQGMRDLFIGTGPFELVEWRRNESLTIDAVDQHWRKVPSVKRVQIYDIPESASRVAMLETGEAQIAGELPFRDISRLQRQGFKLQRDNGLGLERGLFFSGNYWETEHPVSKAKLVRPRAEKPWIGFVDDPDSMERARKVRWALAMAIDREGINQSLMEGLGEVCYLNQISVNQEGWQDKWQIPFDPEEARKLLEEAGYPDGFETQLWVGPGGFTAELGDAIAGLWLKHLEVSTRIDRTTYTKFRPSLIRRDNTTIYSSAGDEGKTGFPVHWPKGFQGSALTDGGWGPSFEDPFYSKSLFRMNAEPDIGKRMAMAEEYFDHVYEVMLQPCIVEVPFHPMYNPREVVEWSPYPSMNGNISGMNSFETVVLREG